MGSLRKKLLPPPILTVPKRSGQYTVDINALIYRWAMCYSNNKTIVPQNAWAVGTRHYQVKIGTPIPYRKCLAVVWAALLLRPYLEWCQFIFRTDNHALRWIVKLADAAGKLARRCLRVTDYDFEIVYIGGEKHQTTDAFSTQRTTGRTVVSYKTKSMSWW